MTLANVSVDWTRAGTVFPWGERSDNLLSMTAVIARMPAIAKIAGERRNGA